VSSFSWSSAGLPQGGSPFERAVREVLRRLEAVVNRRIFGRFDFGSFGPSGNGLTDNVAQLEKAVQAVTDAGGGTLVIHGGTFRLASSLEIPEGVSLDFTRGGMLAPESPAVLTVKEPVPMRREQFFDGDGYVDLDGNPDVYPEWFGAKYSAAGVVQDMEPAIMRAALVCERRDDNEIGAVSFEGKYAIGKPIRSRRHGITWKGSSNLSEELTPYVTADNSTQFFGGPMFISYCSELYDTSLPYPDITDDDTYEITGDGACLVSPLLTGSGNAYQIGNWRWLNLIDSVYSRQMHGQAAFTIEFPLRLPAAYDAPGGLIGSVGRYEGISSLSSAFNFSIDGSGDLVASCSLSGGNESLTWTGIAAETTYHIALDYDGTTLRLLASTPGGALTVVASSAASGTWVRNIWEDVIIGPTPIEFPDAGSQLDSVQGAIIGRIRISTISRYGATPGTAPAAESQIGWDANTLIHIPFATNFDVFTVGRDQGGVVYFWLRRNARFAFGRCYYRDLYLNGGIYGVSGAVFTYNTSGEVARPRVFHTGTYGIFFWNNCYNTPCYNPEVESSGSNAVIGYGNAVQGGIHNVVSPKCVGGAVFPMVLNGGSGTVYGPWIQGETPTVAHMLISADLQSTYTIIDPILNTEGTGLTVFYTSILLRGGSCTVIGGVLEAEDEPPITIEGNATDRQSIIIMGVRLVSEAGLTPEWIRFLTAPIERVKVIDCNPLYSDAIPLSLDPEYISEHRNGQIRNVSRLLADNDTTPSIAGGPAWMAENSGGTSITTFDDGKDGDLIEIEFLNGNTTIVDGATIMLAGGVNFVGSIDDILVLRKRGTVWREVSRSVN
jgi:hypothetical protein